VHQGCFYELVRIEPVAPGEALDLVDIVLQLLNVASPGFPRAFRCLIAE
jgi:hypothetical protein